MTFSITIRKCDSQHSPNQWLCRLLLSVVIRYPECNYAECRYAECYYGECRGAEICSTVLRCRQTNQTSLMVAILLRNINHYFQLKILLL